MEHLGLSNGELDEVIRDVRQRYPHVAFPDVQMDNVFHGMQKATSNLIRGKKAIVVTQDDRPFVSAVCSDQYMLIPHEWAVWRFEQILSTQEAFKPLGRANIVPHLLGTNGVRMHLRADFPDSNISIGKDQVNPRAGLKNSLDLSLEWEPWFGGNVKRCTNGLLMWKNLIGGGRKHRMSLDLEENIMRLVSGVEQLDEMFHIWDTWTKKRIAASMAKEMLDASPLSDKQVEKIMELPEIGTNRVLKDQKVTTAWEINSVVTQYIEHEMEDTPSRIILHEKVTDYLSDAFDKAA